MRRRILVAICGTVALSLVLAGAGTYLLLRRQAAQATESSLRNEAEGIVGLIGVATQSRPGVIRDPKVVKGLRLEGISLLVVGPLGRTRGDLPPGVPADAYPADSILAGDTVSGREGDLVWAGASIPGPRGAAAVVLTRSTEPPRAPLGWFLLAGGVALAVGAAVAAWLSDSLTRPLRQAQQATERIAAGDLTAPLPAPPPHATDEVSDLTRSINAMAASLELSRGLERQFLLSVSHDLRTPLTSIRGYADAITEGIGQDPADAARVISAEARRLDRLVRDLLELARLDAHAFSFDLQVLDVAEVVTEATEGFRPTADAAAISLHRQESPHPLPARIDPDRLVQAIANLLENGLRHAAGSVWIEARSVDGNGVEVHVIDDGPGIAAADLPHVFERLYTTERRPAREAGGTGLGLAIVRELATGMGGAVTVTSPGLPDGTGARFTITLPPA